MYPNACLWGKPRVWDSNAGRKKMGWRGVGNGIPGYILYQANAEARMS